ncbi:hypothetical protein SK128_001147, partial [Halocaridina rubra]
MPISNLPKLFGVTIVGYSVADPQPAAMVIETHQQQIVMEKLLKISSDYWNTFINVLDENLYNTANQPYQSILGDIPAGGNTKWRRSFLSSTTLQI